MHCNDRVPASLHLSIMDAILLAGALQFYYWQHYGIHKDAMILTLKNSDTVPTTSIYIILDGIEGCMRIYCTRHDDIHRAGTAS